MFENLRFVLKATGWKEKSKIEARIDKVLTEVGIGEVAPKYPFELSGGEQQRVCPSLTQYAQLLIADEPARPRPQTNEIMEVFRNCKKDDRLMATHDYNMIVKFPENAL